MPRFTEPASRIELYVIAITIGFLLTIVHETFNRVLTAQKQIVRRIDEISIERLPQAPIIIDGQFERLVDQLRNEKRENKNGR